MPPYFWYDVLGKQLRFTLGNGARFIKYHGVNTCTSNACASLNQTPDRAATPMPAIIAAGVASPKAHGQAMTSTDTARIEGHYQIDPRGSNWQ